MPPLTISELHYIQHRKTKIFFSKALEGALLECLTWVDGSTVPNRPKGLSYDDTWTKCLPDQCTSPKRLRQQTIHPTILEHSPMQPASYTCPLTPSWWGATSHRNSYSHTHLYKSDLTSPSRYDSFSHTFLHTSLISHTDLIVRV